MVKACVKIYNVLFRFLTVSTELNGVNLAGSMYVRAFARSPVTKCTIMRCEQTVGPRRANLCTHMHVDKIRSPADFIQIINAPDLHFQGQRFELSTMRLYT